MSDPPPKIRHPSLRINRYIPSEVEPTCPTETVWGHELESIDPTITFRILLQNPNGLKLQSEFEEFALGVKISYTLGAGVISLTETNTNWNQPYHLKQVTKAFRDKWKTMTFQASQHPEHFHQQSQRGGTLQVLTEQWVSRLQTKGIDPYGLGRWSYMTLGGKGNKKVVIISAYRVCNTTLNSSGDCTAYMQQFRSILAYNNDHNISSTPNPHRQFVIDLQAWIEMLQSEGASIILALDANEDILSTTPTYHPLEYKDGNFIQAPQHNGHLATLLMTCGLIDTLSHSHPPPYPSTYFRGKTRMDYILVSRDLLPSLQRSGVLPLYSIFMGDHCPCYVDLDSTVLFSDPTHPIAHHTHRGIQLLDPRKVDKYIDTLLQQLDYHKVFNKLDDMDSTLEANQWCPHSTQGYSTTDVVISDSMIHAERCITSRRTQTYDWSTQIANLYKLLGTGD